MRRSLDTLSRPATFSRRYATSVSSSRPPIVSIEKGTFYRRQPSSLSEEGNELNRPLFPNLDFSFPADNVEDEYWSIIGPSNAGKTTFLEILRGQYLCYPPKARLYPYLSTDEIAAKDSRLRYPGRAIQYVGFNDKQKGLSGLGTYLSARYESRREETDFSVLDYLRGNTQLNAADPEAVDEALLDRVLRDLRLSDLATMPLTNLSNGQSRRARIAKALLSRPELLLLDEVFMGLDPPTMASISTLLQGLAQANNPRLLLALRPQDPIPQWITHVLFLGDDLKITHQGPKREVGRQLIEETKNLINGPRDAPDHVPRFYGEFGRSLTTGGIAPSPQRMSGAKRAAAEKAQALYDTGDRSEQVLKDLGVGEVNVRGWSGLGATAYPLHTHVPPPPTGEPLIEMDGVVVKYGDKVVLGGWRQKLPHRKNEKDGLVWTVRRGERWGVFGPNGSGKTTLFSMITSDHPQCYSAPLKLFGRGRLPTRGTPGISLFELQSRIGHSSPEVHAFFPRSLTVRATLESAYADAPLSRPKGLTVDADRRIDACLRWFQAELNPALGMNPVLKDELLRRTDQERLEYVKEGMAEKYQEASREYWAAHDVRQAESIEWADTMLFGELPFSAQRVALFIRAIVKGPDVVILDEAFSGMDDYVRDKCLLFLEAGETKVLSPYVTRYDYSKSGLVEKNRGRKAQRGATMTGLGPEQALICISHVKEEVPNSVRDWIYLPEAGKGEVCRVGRADVTPIRGDPSLWGAIWGLKRIGGAMVL